MLPLRQDDQINVEKGWDRYKEKTINPIQDAPMPREDIARVLYSIRAFQETLKEVTEIAKENDQYRQCNPVRYSCYLREKGVKPNSPKNGYHATTDGTLPTLIRGYTTE